MPGGRTSKFTPEVADRIVDAVAVGAPLRLAAAHGGIGERTLHRWLEVGEGPPGAARIGSFGSGSRPLAPDTSSKWARSSATRR